MDRIAATENFLVFDNVLGGDRLSEVAEYMRHEDFFEVHRDGYVRVFSTADGRPLRSQAVLAPVPGSPAPEREPGVHVYPTGTEIDTVLEKLLESAHELEGVVGRKGEAWQGLVGRGWLYPPGTGLGWHDDAHCAGAFIYFAHPTWSLDWGGELLVCERSEPRQRESAVAEPSALRAPRPLPAGASGGRFIAPVPDRLVVLALGATHKIAPVSPLAGHHVRASISGFFLAPPKTPS